MSGANSFGQRIILTSFGESHGAALGAVLDGVPAGVRWQEELLFRELERRRPGGSIVVSARSESDRPEVLSGVFDGRTLGTPIAVIVRNHDARSEDYRSVVQNPRMGHADDVWRVKFGHFDSRGGGRASGRETLARVIGGSIAAMVLAELAPACTVRGFATQIGPITLSNDEAAAFGKLNDAYPADRFIARFPSSTRGHEVEDLLLGAKNEGRSYGGTAEIQIDGVPAGLGQPVFRKLKADLAGAMMSVGATSSLEIGDGESATRAEGSEFHGRSDESRYGGIRGGLSTGERVVVRVGFKPTSSVLEVAKRGRHDPCIVPRAIPVLEAMAKLVIADHLLWSRTDRI